MTNPTEDRALATAAYRERAAAASVVGPCDTYRSPGRADLPRHPIFSLS